MATTLLHRARRARPPAQRELQSLARSADEDFSTGTESFQTCVPGKKGSIANGITPDGTVYGCDHDDDYFLSMFGFARIRNSGEGDEGSENGDTSSQQSTAFSYITLNAGGGELVDPAQSVPASMNNGATPDGKIIVGLYFDMTGQPHGYVVKNGTFRPYDVPGSTGTLTWEINPAADFVGYYFDGNGNQHGFLQRWGESVPITVDAPSEPPFNSILSNAFGINPQGAIAGLYIDSGAVWHGFIAVPGTSR